MDVDRHTGAIIGNFESACQGVEVVLSTRIGELLMRREYGGGIVELLGRSMTPALFSAWQQLVATAIDTWEPRFKVRKISPSGSVEEIRGGVAKLSIELDYRPRGHLGDAAVERVVNLPLTIRAGRLVSS